jgi:hypothetical protein
MDREEIRNTIINNIKNYFIKNNTPIIKQILEYIDYFNTNTSKCFEELKEEYEETNITSSELKDIFNKEVYDPNDYKIIINFIVYKKYINYEEFNIREIVTKLDSEKIYYSSYGNDMTKEIFKQKKSCWFSEQEDQALIHQLDRSYLGGKPIMFEFKLTNNPNVINSSNIFNHNILLFFGIENINKFLTDMGDKFAPDNLALGYNKYILYICEAYNQYLQSNEYLNYNYELLKINGYCNKKDQYEIALTSFDSFVDNKTIIKYVFTKIVKNKVDFVLPFTQDYCDLKEKETGNAIHIYKEKFNNNIKVVNSHDLNIDAVHRMSCGDKSDVQIHYKNEITNEEKIFDCADKSEQYYWRKKYLKYKNKYLTLKK